MGNMRIYLGRESSKYAKIAGGAIITITSLFFVLMAMGFEITGTDDICLGTPEDPCVSYGKICNLGPDNFDIYNPDEVALDFSPTVKNYWIFFKDGRVKKNYFSDKGINFDSAGWRFENFTDATKPRKDRVYVHRFARYSCQEYMLVGLKEDSDDVIKWGVGVGKEYLDPFWYGVNSSPSISTSSEIKVELGTEINMSTNITGASRVCVDIDHPDYGDNYTCGSPTANFNINISYFRKTEFNDSTETKNITYGGGLSDLDALNGQVIGITSYGEYIDTVDSADDLVYRYYKNGTGVETVDITPAGSNNPRGMDSNGTNLRIVDYSDLRLYNLLNNGTLVDYCALGISYPYGVTINATHFWISDYTADRVYNYLNNCTQIGSFALNAANSDPRGMDNDGTHMTVLDNDGYAYKYTMDGTYVSSQDVASLGVVGNLAGLDIQDGVCRVTGYSDKAYAFNCDDWTNYNGEPQYVYFDVNEMDELSNFSLNFTGYDEADIDVYFNDTLIASGGKFYDGTLQITDLISGYLFTEPGTQSFTIDISADANVTSAFTNITAGATSQAYDQEMVEIESAIFAGNSIFAVQSFVPTYANLTNILVYLHREDFTPSGNVYFNLGTTINGSEIESESKPMSNLKFSTGGSGEWETTGLNGTLTPGTTYYLTVWAPDSSEVYWWGSDYGNSYYDDGQAFFKVGASTGNWSFDSTFRTRILSNPSEVKLEVGEIDNDPEFNFTGEMTSSDNVKTDDFAEAINDYLVNCTIIDNICTVPFYLSTEEPGYVYTYYFEVNYTTAPNPVYLDLDDINIFLAASDGDTTLELEIASTEPGTFGVGGIAYDYKGGNSTINILTYNATSGVDKTVNDTINMIVYYSDYIKQLPYTWTTALFFLPSSNSSKNITAYGQSPTTPIMNITSTSYGGLDTNFSMRLNQSFSCIDISWNATGNTKPTNQKLNTTWQQILSEVAYLDNPQIWMWADLENCDPTVSNLLRPQLELESYCEECVWSGS